MSLYPLIFTPVLKTYVWGGRGLAERLGRVLPDGNVAESWEIAAHQDGTTTVANGPWQGTPLTALQARLGLGLVGRRAAWAQQRGKFPLLIKLLDAAAPLSVQVHPPDAYALAHEGDELGKTEMWVVLHAAPGASVILGVAAGTTPAAFRQAVEMGKLEPYLHRVPVQTGDVVCVPAGTLHAILGGVIIAEIQQNSNTTYRVYDWNRLDANGQPRELHVKKALDVIEFAQAEPGLCQPQPAWTQRGIRAFTLCQNACFVTERVEMAARAEYTGLADGETLEIWGVIQGEAVAAGGGEQVVMPAVQFVLMPASLGPFTLHSQTETVLLRTYLPPGS
ncbi:MAG: class I mannose-6-phosphate isomerase [Candidatus Promineifilaceae bacterium]